MSECLMADKKQPKAEKTSNNAIREFCATRKKIFLDLNLCLDLVFYPSQTEGRVQQQNNEGRFLNGFPPNTMFDNAKIDDAGVSRTNN